MSTIADIKSAIERLSVEERAELVADLCGWRDDDWDKQMKADAKAGKFVALNEDATNAYQAVAQLEAAACRLSPAERDELCSRLAGSLEAPLSPEEQAWAGLAGRRAEELHTGKVAGVPADEVFAKARRKPGL